MISLSITVCQEISLSISVSICWDILWMFFFLNLKMKDKLVRHFEYKTYFRRIYLVELHKIYIKQETLRNVIHLFSMSGVIVQIYIIFETLHKCKKWRKTWSYTIHELSDNHLVFHIWKILFKEMYVAQYSLYEWKFQHQTVKFKLQLSLNNV